LPKEPRKIGLFDGKFYRCPKKHICVSTMSDKSDDIHYIEPLKYDSSLDEVKKRVKTIVKSLKRTKLLEERDNYIRFEITTALLRFKDDVEFLFDEMNKIIHFKSQSRIGGYDWNANRNRMEKIKKLFMK
jgi:uncharacterized protein (DUF1499 family)